MHAFLDNLQIHMAEILFRPRRVLLSAWHNGRDSQRQYRGAAALSLLAALGFGIVLGWSLSGDEAFALSSDPSFVRSVGGWFLVIWAVFSIYLLCMAALIETISWIRR